MSLPAILCLHGSGVNATIFQFQTATLQHLLSKTFTFIFLDGPFETRAGPGVLPFFDGCEPFFRWKSKSDDNVFATEEVEDEVRTLIRETLKTRDDWVGILGFSQGGRMAAGLLAEQERREEVGEEEEGAGFKFGVFVMTPEPPMTGLVYEEGVEVRIQSPSVLVSGKKDFWYESSKRMREKYFEEETSKLVEFDVDHRMPNASADVKIIALEVLRLYLETTGIRGILNQ
ncbi:uncharacterized protein LY89DRAFT_609880 [Mollisia scopiformis]|uniref:Serine hydrolase domain-containing protein n=1 Tax=Mollisia scopiformis TaxID=149040 RepID=A0A194XNM0_MOLSC|nr:uncharacterized protein LY89DRAFT_609880 [Mollisia scopiformis]KUJ21327.1 hypothetical protein LY89DRAFT_609880 [Mollisia scopiformis]